MASFGDLPTEIAQKCVEFLDFDEAIEVKSISRGLIAAALESWTDMKLAVQLLEESMSYGAGRTTFVAKAHMWSANWKDKEKANDFWTKTFQKYGYEWC